MFKKIAHIIRRIRMAFESPSSYARRSGVIFGKNCNFRTKKFGSEPFLIEVGDSVHTASGVSFVTHDGSVNVLRNLFPECKNADLFGKIKIGSNVFIGMNAIIGPGSNIGNNVIVGAGSFVKGELKDNSVYAGVPIKYICSLEEYYNKNREALVETKGMLPHQKERFLKGL